MFGVNHPAWDQRWPTSARLVLAGCSCCYLERLSCDAHLYFKADKQKSGSGAALCLRVSTSRPSDAAFTALISCCLVLSGSGPGPGSGSGRAPQRLSESQVLPDTGPEEGSHPGPDPDEEQPLDLEPN